MHDIIQSDCLEWLRSQPDDSVDLVIGSPPYEDARTYNMDFSLKGEQWVRWMFERVLQMVRVSRGLVVMVCEGKTENFSYSATPLLLAADLKRAGITLRKPPIYYRVGIPGSGGPDYWRNDYEFCIVATKAARLPWSNNLAGGSPPKYQPGGRISHRTKSGERVNRRTITRMREGMHAQTNDYVPPKIANPGNVIHCKVGGGLLGSDLAHENEAPYPEALVERFIRSFCPPNGLVLDPFGGSGTTLAVAILTGRKSISIDCRECQIELMQRRKVEAFSRLVRMYENEQNPVLSAAFSRLRTFDAD